VDAEKSQAYSALLRWQQAVLRIGRKGGGKLLHGINSSIRNMLVISNM
jgi:hypothetical protein